MKSLFFLAALLTSSTAHSACIIAAEKSVYDDPSLTLNLATQQLHQINPDIQIVEHYIELERDLPSDVTHLISVEKHSLSDDYDRQKFEYDLILSDSNRTVLLKKTKISKLNYHGPIVPDQEEEHGTRVGQFFRDLADFTRAGFHRQPTFKSNSKAILEFAQQADSLCRNL
jgi:hypothetical protein